MKKIFFYVCTIMAFGFLGAGSLRAQDEDLSVDPRAYWHFACALYAQALQDSGRATVEFDQAARYDPTSPIIHDRLASHYYVEGLEYKTEEELQKSIKLEPNNIQTRLLLANLFASQGEYGKAQKEYEKILEIDTANIEARYYLAGVLANQNRIDDALLAYQKILDVNPKTAGVYYNMGLIYTRANQVTKAEQAFKKAIEIDPTLEQAYTSLGLVYELDQKPKDAIDTYEALTKVAPGKAQTFLALGELYYNEKDNTKALEAFLTYAKLDPKDSAVYDYIGLCYYGLKDNAKAVESFQKLLESQPTNALVHFRLSAVYEDMKDFADAEDQVKVILANDSKSVDAWVRLGILYDKENKKDLTRKTIADGLKANPDHPELVLMKAMFAQEEDNLTEAEPEYRKVIQSELMFKNKQQVDYNLGTLAQAYFNLATILDKENRFDEAMDTMKKVIQVQPDNAEAFNYIGYSYADKNQNLGDAEKYVETAMKLDPNNSYYLDSLGWVFYRQSRFTEAKDTFDKALKLLPEKKEKDDAVIFDHLAETEIKLGQTDDAVAQWKQAVELDPDNKDFAAKLQKYQPASSDQ